MTAVDELSSVATLKSMVRLALLLMPLLKAFPHDDRPIIEAIINSIQHKPKGHDFDLKRVTPAVIRFMSHTGG